jgi:4-amino-4-deoxy-L-arabinose transferase-like glycosyltransferase
VARLLTSFRSKLGAIVAIGLLIRWATVWFHYRHLSPPPPDLTDNTWYWLQANLFADGEGYANPIYWWRDGVIQHSAGHPPLYTTYLGIFSFLGLDTPLAMRMASGLLGAATIALVGVLAKRLSGSDAAGLIAAGLAAVYPNLWINDGLILSESLYAPLIALVLLLAHRLIGRPDLLSAAALGGALGLGLLTRSETQALLVVLLVPLALWSCRKVSWWDRFKILIVSGGVALLIATPWVAKNLTTFEHPVFLAIGAGFTAEVGNCDDTYYGDLLGYWSNDCGTGWEDQLDDQALAAGCFIVPRAGPGTPAEEQHLTSLVCDESVIEKVKRDRAQAYIEDNLDRVPVVVAARVGRIWNVYRPMQGVDLDIFFERRGRLAAQSGLWSFYLLGAFALAGGFALWKRKVNLVPELAMVAVVTITAATTFGITRYRVASEVVWVLLAGIGAHFLWTRFRASRAEAEATEPEP